MSECEWNPALNRPAYDTDPPHAKALWGLGRGKRNIHLCDSCAKLPRFARLSRRPLGGPEVRGE